ncbi:N(6)-adenine-specific methyltransferase METTL4 isoform X2 [Melopsittacus undulatus]|uniref:N(6)-adenine-specific methyltransferase METTL4 isoform X2 n=1 Tax=Melopsittacus undulatus TaxID=13146 RepID=UPI00146C0B30|nr:N(6)-adenine-specific methyltransferase METTL4 isoform X2 [Melopsittacus undulatus]
MSVVHRLTAGWLVDHLSFINQCGYEICDSFVYRDGITLDTSVVSTRDCHSTSTFAVTSSSDGPIPGPEDAIETEGKPAKTRYMFREEFFDVSKPHIAAAPEEQLWQGCPEGSLTELKASSNKGEHQAETKNGVGDSVASARKKHKRKCVFNQGELDALQYHSKVRKLIWEGTLHLVQEGHKSGFLHRTIPEPSCRKNAVPGRIGYKKKYDVIVIDPPWENKSVKRSSRYSYLSSCQIKQIPVPALAAPNCLVVTWVTNRQKHLHFVKDELYPHWSVKTLAEWHWVKITGAGEFVFPLDSLHKKPYEVLVLGRVQGDVKETLRKSEDVLPVPEHKLIVSIPCRLHSHKPPLTGVLAEFLKADVECLEMFARNLQPGWTSWGNEVLKFQHMDYFTVLQHED